MAGTNDAMGGRETLTGARMTWILAIAAGALLTSGWTLPPAAARPVVAASSRPAARPSPRQPAQAGAGPSWTRITGNVANID